jgi:hypothetical protein
MVLLSLEQIWSKQSKAINDILRLPYHGDGQRTFSTLLANKVKVAQLYSKSGQLIPDDRMIVDHPLFEKIAITSGRFADIKAKIGLLLLLEPLFNEKNLLVIINDYNPVEKIYIYNYNTLNVYDAETLVREQAFGCDHTGSPVYYKGRLYSLHYGSCMDLASHEVLNFPEISSDFYMLSRIGNLLYCAEYPELKSLNLDTLEVTSTGIGLGNGQSIDGDMIYIIDSDMLVTYDGRTSPPTLISRRSFDSGDEIGSFEVIGDRVYLDSLRIYSLETLELLAVVEFGSHTPDIYSYGNRLYAVIYRNVESEIRIYDTTSFQWIGMLMDRNELFRLKDVKIEGNKILVFYYSDECIELKLKIFNLDNNESFTIVLPSRTYCKTYLTYG